MIYRSSGPLPLKGGIYHQWVELDHSLGKVYRWINVLHTEGLYARFCPEGVPLYRMAGTKYEIVVTSDKFEMIWNLANKP